MSRPVLALLPLLLACKGEKSKLDDTGSGAEDTATGWRPDLVCPGDAGCADADGALLAGAAKEPITPTCFELWDDVDGDGSWKPADEPWFDCGCDQRCEGDDGWPGADEGEGDGEFQGAWIAGFGNSRPANGVHDDLWARAVVVEKGATSVAIVTLDVVGWFYDDAVKVREAAAALGADVDLVVVHASHVHEAPDTLGQWGQRIGKTGVVPEYQQYIVDQAARAVADAAAAAAPATLRAGVIDTAAPFGARGTHNTVRDSRDPVIIEERLYTARFTDASGGTIATLVNWGNHPEVLGGDNTLITSDFVHYLREGVEGGVSWEDGGGTEGLGGVCLFVNASVGGLMTPLGVTVETPDGNAYSGDTWEKAEALGMLMADLALQADAAGSDAADPGLSLRAARLYIPIENFAFQAMFLIGVFDREIYHYDPDRDIDDTNIPEVLTEIDVVDIGPISLLTLPGEATPELSIGGYDGSRVNSDEVEFIGSDNPNPPDVSQAPDGPFFKELMTGEHAWIVGLGNDELGYFVPPYDYELDASSPYLSEAEGDHYEETNSVGPGAVPRIIETVEKLAAWSE